MGKLKMKQTKTVTTTTHSTNYGLLHTIKQGLSYVPQIVSESLLPNIVKSGEVVLKRFDDRLLFIERRIIRKMSSLLVIGFGGVLLIFSLFFFFSDLGLSNALSFLYIGVIVFVIGVLLKVMESSEYSKVHD